MNTDNDLVRLRCSKRTWGLRCTNFVMVQRGTDPKAVKCDMHNHARHITSPKKTVVVQPTKKTKRRDYFVK